MVGGRIWTPRVYYVEAFGWQLDYRPGGWLPLDVDDLDWRIVRLGRFGCITLGRVGAA